ncbi:MAG: hypothetical protein ABFE08_03025 [Armatimonadia bacterium]
MELMDDLYNGSVTWPDWRQRVEEFDSILDPKLPILLGGPDLVYLAGLSATAPAEVFDATQISTMLWRMLRQSASASDLDAGIRVSSRGRRFHLSNSASNTKTLVDTGRAYWVNYLTHVGSPVSTLNAERIAQQKKPLKPAEIRRLVETELGVAFPPLAGDTQRLTPVLDALTRFLHLAGTPNSKFNPLSPKRTGDYFDWNLLFALALENTIIVTADKRIAKALDEMKSPSMPRIVELDSLENHLTNGTLASLIQ